MNQCSIYAILKLTIFLLPITDGVAGGVLQYIVYWTRYWSVDRSEFQFISSYIIHYTVSSTQFVTY